MEALATFLSLVALVVAVYTAVFALDTWRSGNRFGGGVLFLLAVLAFAFPAYTFLAR